MNILGSGFPTACERRSDDVTIHWWAEPAKANDRCLCGEKSYQPKERHLRAVPTGDQEHP